jgi:hypothetical protein
VALDLSRRWPPERFADAGESLDVFVGTEVAATGSFEHDGADEAVVSLNLGGNACPGPSYVLVRASGARVSVSPTFGECQGPLKVVSGGASTDRFVVEGLERRYTFRPTGGAVVADGEEVIPPLPVTLSITYDQVESRAGGRVWKVDLDGDGRPDKIECAALRFLTCTLTGSTGEDWGTIVAPGRLGVLTSTTRGHRDLVVGPALMVRWNGHEYG